MPHRQAQKVKMRISRLIGCSKPAVHRDPLQLEHAHCYLVTCMLGQQAEGNMTAMKQRALLCHLVSSSDHKTNVAVYGESK